MYPPKPPKPGDPIRASWANDVQDEVSRLGRIRGGAGLSVRNGTAGPQVSLDLPEQAYLRITGGPNGAGGYSWEEVIHQPGNSWVTTGRTGSLDTDGDAAYPINSANAPAVSQVYPAARPPSSRAWVIDVASGSSGDVLIVTVTSIAGATWSTTSFAPGTGTCKVVSYNSTTSDWVIASATSPIKNPYPDSAPANRFGYAQVGPGGVLYLKTLSCTSVVATGPTPTTTAAGGASLGLGSGASGSIAWFRSGSSATRAGRSTGVGTSTSTSTTYTLGQPTYVGKLPLVPDPT